VILVSKYEKLFFYTIPVFLFSLIPFFLITGPFLSDLAVSIIGLSFLIYCTKKKNFSFFKKKYFYFFLIFWIYLIINSLFNNFNLDSLKISFFYIRFPIFFIAIIALLKFDNRFMKYFFYCILVCFSSLLFDGLYQYYSGENIFGLKKQTEYRVSSFFGDELILGSYLSRLLPLFFAILIVFFKDSKKYLIFSIIIFILCEVLVFLSGERTALFYINLSALFIIFFSNNLKKLRLVSFCISLSLIVLISFLFPQAKKRVVDQTIDQLNISNLNKNIEKIYIFSKQHTHHYISAYRMFLDNKFFGVGVKNFRNFCDDKKYNVSKLSCSTHPHNSYIQILSETGLFGFFFLIVLLLSYIYYLAKHIFCKFKKSYFFTDFQICVLSGIAIILWPFAPTGSIFNNWLNITYFLYLTFFIWSIENKSINNK
jgi:O-antigen ligase